MIHLDMFSKAAGIGDIFILNPSWTVSKTSLSVIRF